MNLVGIDSITPYEGVYEFSVYKYDDKIDLGNKELFVCDLKIVLTKVKKQYIEKLNKSVNALCLVKNVNLNIDKKNLKEELKEFIFQEVYEENLQKDNIDIMFIEETA
ncbi:MAG: hypothetical protein RSB70_06965 [Clostridium sp.]